MLKFSYQDYIVKEEGNELEFMVVQKVEATSFKATHFFYLNKKYITDKEVVLKIEEDTERNEQYINYENKRIYASEYYNPEITTFVSI